MPPAPRLNREFFWECAACRRSYRSPETAAHCSCPCPNENHRAVVAPLVRWPEVPLRDGHPLALTAWLQGDQAEVTVMYRAEEEEDGTLRATGYRFCASREGLEATGAFAFVPA